jgi:hypothetical protein
MMGNGCRKFERIAERKSEKTPLIFAVFVV